MSWSERLGCCNKETQQHSGFKDKAVILPCVPALGSELASLRRADQVSRAALNDQVSGHSGTQVPCIMLLQRPLELSPLCLKLVIPGPSRRKGKEDSWGMLVPLKVPPVCSLLTSHGLTIQMTTPTLQRDWEMSQVPCQELRRADLGRLCSLR